MFYDPIAPEYILNQPQSQADELNEWRKE